MGNHRASSSTVVAGFVAAVCLFTLTADSARAQQTTTGRPPPPGQRDPFAEVRERQQRETQLRSMEMLATGKPKERRGADAAAAEQLREDFKNIQILRNKLVRHLKSAQPLDYKFIAAETGEINRRAGRLKTQLLRAVAKDDRKEPEPPVEISDAQMKDALVTMCKRIDSFTESPVFKVPDVVNVEESAKANRDLRHIILLSGGIKRTAERLNQPHKK